MHVETAFWGWMYGLGGELGEIEHLGRRAGSLFGVVEDLQYRYFNRDWEGLEIECG